jgi:3-oxoadipate enol-lactonase
MPGSAERAGVTAGETLTVELPTGAAVAYTDTGGDHPALLLGHGFLLDHTMFDAQAAALRDSCRVITWDARGFGATRDSGAPFTYWDQAEDALALLTELGIDQAVVGGMSQGGFIAMRATLLAPERVRALVLIDTQAGGEDPDVAPLYEAMHTSWVTDGATDDLARTALGLVLSDDPAILGAWLPRVLARPKDALTAPFRCLMDRDDITPRLSEISAPALVIHGTADGSIPVEKAQALVDGLPNARPLVLVEGGAHASNVTHPDVVNAALIDFLAGL